MMQAFLTIAVIYAVLLVCLYFQQRRLLYFPQNGVQSPASHGASGFESVTFSTADGLSLSGWWHDAAPGFATVIHFHGNAGNVGGRAGFYQQIADAGFGVLAVDYRGYGVNTGEPSEEGLYADARAAIHFALGERGLPIQKIILYGESLGSGVAVQMATEYPVAGLVLEAPYTSVLARAQARFPFVPVTLLLKDRYDSLNKMPQVKAPLLLFHGERDRVIPVHDGRTVLAAANPPKKGIFFPEVDHTQFPRAELVAAMQEFGQVHGWAPDAQQP